MTSRSCKLASCNAFAARLSTCVHCAVCTAYFDFVVYSSSSSPFASPSLRLTSAILSLGVIIPSKRSNKMATKMATRPTQGSQLPLGLHPYHMLYLSVVCTIVFGGTAYAAFTGSNLFNISEGLDRLDILSEASSSSPTSHSLFLPPKGYFANKRNIINRLFVKKAWAWNTAAFILQAVFLKSHISSTAREAAQRKKDDDAGNTTAAQKANATKQSNITSPLSLSMLRYFAATFCWGERRIHKTPWTEH